ncbi:MAG: (2Fe-2S)-binding protein [Thermoanaerobaculia bacterium]|nr:(2Fe-2S)-binding protein [Thermoanaerobaculia bacterium]
MPKLTIEGHGTADVQTGTRLVLAIRDSGVEIGHRCGGFGKCTTCRVECLDGEPNRMTEAEREKLDAAELEGIRLACQLTVDRDMSVRALMTVGDQPWEDPGPQPAETIEPEPVWLDR